MSGRSAKGSSLRLLRVSENVRHALAGILSRGDLRDPQLADATITVSAVEVSPDLRHADVFVMPILGGKSDTLLDALSRSAGEIRNALAKQVRMKYLPQLHFKLDESFDEGDHIERLLQSEKVRRDLDPDEDE